MTHSRRMDIMRRELRKHTLAEATGLQECVWSPFRASRPARPYAEWRPITQPSSSGTILDDLETLELPRQVDVQILSATVGQPYRVEYNYTAVESLPASGATVTTIRDDLVTKTNADRDPVTASAVSTDILRLTADSPGSLWRVESVGALTAVSVAGGSPVDIVNLQRASLRMTASLNIYSDDVGSDDDASFFGHLVDVGFRKDRVYSDLQRNHLAVDRIADPVNLDGVPPSQASFESRVAVDFRISLPYWDSEFIEEIDTCNITVNTDKGSIAFTV